MNDYFKVCIYFHILYFNYKLNYLDINFSIRKIIHIYFIFFLIKSRLIFHLFNELLNFYNLNLFINFKKKLHSVYLNLLYQLLVFLIFLYLVLILPSHLSYTQHQTTFLYLQRFPKLQISLETKFLFVNKTQSNQFNQPKTQPHLNSVLLE